MKKLLLFAALAVFGIGTSFAQGDVKLGINGAIPMGDFDEAYSFGVIADVAYLFDINETFKVGPMTSFLYYFGKDQEGSIGDVEIEVDADDAAFLPLGGTARFYLDEAFYFGADLGYGIGISPDGNDGGFYYRPRAAYNFGNIGIVLSYSGVALDGATFSSLNFGVEFGL